MELGLHTINFTLQTTKGSEIVVKTLRVMVRRTIKMFVVGLNFILMQSQMKKIVNIKMLLSLNTIRIKKYHMMSLNSLSCTQRKNAHLNISLYTLLNLDYNNCAKDFTHTERE